MMDNIAKLYDELYRSDLEYNTLDENNRAKLKYILAYVNDVRGSVLDAGTGKGNLLRYLLSKGIVATGIEISEVCCEKYLNGLPIENVDIVMHAEMSRQDRYAGLVCTDVVEHIPESKLDKTLDALAKLAQSALFGIANHSSIHRGYELHLIQQGIEWWTAQLLKRYKTVQVIQPRDKILSDHLENDRFFFLKATKL